ncbi:DUF4169 family protein [Methylocystis parvus]|uniref:DUF4169 family protein n=1 Tax=Methylocystis parvus TaxID=134 RepID=A0A6B8M5E1_9HYPH|nr:DUF4169 family protein [Methylocystis parvus]QGM97638.1 DUF4169 family protein [Methylocystis parvus]WBJ98428.1 DUF4169 family protein [Methylocystis parvus OBBP]
MGEIVNLRRARKARDRREKEEAAQANRVAYGRTKAERELNEARKRLEAEKLDAHRRDTPEEPA